MKVSGQSSLLVCVLYQHSYPSKGHNLSNPALKSQSATAVRSTLEHWKRLVLLQLQYRYTSYIFKRSESIFYLILIECKMNQTCSECLSLTEASKDWSHHLWRQKPDEIKAAAVSSVFLYSIHNEDVVQIRCRADVQHKHFESVQIIISNYETDFFLLGSKEKGSRAKER